MVVRFGPMTIGATIVQSWPAILGSAGILSLGLISGSLAWWLLFPRRCRPRLLHLVPAHLAGYALNRLLPTGNMGELARIGFLHRVVPMQELTASLVVATLLGTVVGQLFAVVGSVVALTALPLSTWIGLSMLGVSLGMTAFTVGLLVMFRFGLFGRLTAFLTRFSWFSKLGRFVEKMQRLDKALADVSRFDRRDTLKCLAVLFFVRLTHLGSSALVVGFVLPSLSAGESLLVAFVLSTAGQLIEWVLAIIPQGIGAVEGGNAVIFLALGLDPALGISIALCQRVAGLILATLSLLGFIRPAPPVAHAGMQDQQNELSGGH
ncbi:MAG: flippase-like domain-containing protein [Deltaproteobacteria bacterium]|nr:flippase-like domain-containing protein [Deltaproteobacteria bacterium]